MEEIKDLQTDVLMDMLAGYTSDYSRMIKEGYEGNEFINCQTKIEEIQSEILFRSKFEQFKHNAEVMAVV